MTRIHNTRYEDSQYYLRAIAKNVNVVITAKNNSDNKENKIELTLIELQTVMHMFVNVRFIDQSDASIPMYSNYSFSNLCNNVLVKFIDIQKNNGSDFVVDFNAKPKGIFSESLKVTFLMNSYNKINTADIKISVPNFN